MFFFTVLVLGLPVRHADYLFFATTGLPIGRTFPSILLDFNGNTIICVSLVNMCQRV